MASLDTADVQLDCTPLSIGSYIDAPLYSVRNVYLNIMSVIRD